MKLSIILGAAAVAGAVYYFTTPEGKAFAKKVCDESKGLSDSVTAFAEEILGKGKDLFGKAKDVTGSATASV